MRSAADSNAVIDDSKEALDEFAAAIMNKDASIIDGIDQQTFMPKFLRFRIPSELGQKIPSPMKEVFEMVISKVKFFI